MEESFHTFSDDSIVRLRQSEFPANETMPHIRIIKSIEDIEKVRSIWEAFQVHPVANINYYLESLKNDPQVISPCVLLFYESNMLRLIVVGRIIEMNLVFKIGYLPVYKTRARVLSIIEQGVMGNCGDQDARYIVEALMDLLAQGEADMAHLASIPVESPIYLCARKAPKVLFRGYLSPCEKRWELHLAGSYQQFLEGLSPKSRSTNLRSYRKVERAFKDRLTMRVVSDPEDLAAAFDEMEAVASKTYQRRLGTGFMNTPQERRLLKSLAHREMVSADLLYIDNEAVAFCYGLHHKQVYVYETPGYDPKYADYRVGNYLLLKLIERLCNNSTTKIIDFGLGDAQYKQVYSNKVVVESNVRIFAPTWKGFSLNFARTLTFLISKIIANLLKRFDIYDRVKRFARARMRSHN
jgi:hypothetical protein